MNSFVQHHRDAIAFTYHCFDRLLFNGCIPHFLWGGGRAHVFFQHHRHLPTVTPNYLRLLSADFHRSVQDQAAQAGVEIVVPPVGVRREDWVQPYYQRLDGRDGLAVILRPRERARVLVSYPKRGHFLEYQRRYVDIYYLYLRDPQLGRFWLRLCPYFPFPIQVCLNGHEWLARQMLREGITFRQRDNVFVGCDDPQRLQELADAFGPEDILQVVEPALARWIPFFSEQERAEGFRHRLYMCQVEYCQNLVFHKRRHLDGLFGRLLDHNRGIGHPEKLGIIFGRAAYRPDTRTGQSEVVVTPSRTSVLRARYKNTVAKQYVKDGVSPAAARTYDPSGEIPEEALSDWLLPDWAAPGEVPPDRPLPGPAVQGEAVHRVETASFQLKDLSLPKDLENLPRVRTVLAASNDRFLEVQQDVLASYVDRGQLEQLGQPTVSAAGRRTPGLRVDDQRLLAVLRALTSLAYVVGLGGFRTKDLLPDVQRCLSWPEYTLARLRYDLGKLRAKGLLQRLPGTQRYELSSEGYRLAVLYQKLSDRLYGPLTSGIVDPVAGDARVPGSRKARLDKQYERVDKALKELEEAVGVVSGPAA